MKIGIEIDGKIVFIEVSGLDEEKLAKQARKQLAEMVSWEVVE